MRQAERWQVPNKLATPGATDEVALFLRWKLPHRPARVHWSWFPLSWRQGRRHLKVMSCWVAGAGYAVCVDFLDERQIKRWSDERKAAVRRRNMQARIHRVAPLFADELIERELAARPEYFNGKSAR